MIISTNATEIRLFTSFVCVCVCVFTGCQEHGVFLHDLLSKCKNLKGNIFVVSAQKRS